MFRMSRRRRIAKPILKFWKSGNIFLFLEKSNDMIPDKRGGHHMMQTAPKIWKGKSEISCRSS
jgi:hypothetical protein